MPDPFGHLGSTDIFYAMIGLGGHGKEGILRTIKENQEFFLDVQKCMFPRLNQETFNDLMDMLLCLSGSREIPFQRSPTQKCPSQ